jgi:hypothetical protein
MLPQNIQKKIIFNFACQINIEIFYKKKIIWTYFKYFLVILKQ